MKSEDVEETGLRILKAAGQVLSGKGFRGATIREIRRQAKVNVAAVNYHFGNKKKLYETVLVYAFDEALKKYPPDRGLSADSSAPERLRAFIRSFLLRMTYGKLMAGEMLQPTPAPDSFITRSLFVMLKDIIRDIVGPDVSDDFVSLAAVSIAGQCQHYSRSGSVIVRLCPEVRCDPQNIGRLTDFITEFSLAAIKNYPSGVSKP